MAIRHRISPTLRRALAIEAAYACSYCRSPALAGVAMAVDHIIPLARGGSHGRGNLCQACYRCNEFKGPLIQAVDPLTEQIVALYHPKTQIWAEHFAWSSDGLQILGLTAHGRTTVAALRMNDPWVMRARQIWILAGIHPPLN